MKIQAAFILLFAALPATPSVAAEEHPTVPVSIFATVYAEGLKSVFVKRGADTFQSVTLSTANVVEGGEALVEQGRISL